MSKKIFLFSFLLISIIGIYYPTTKENTKVYDYCYSLEKILSRNAIEARNYLPGKVKSISKDISRFGINNTKGSLIEKMIEQYKISNNTFLINLIPSRIYCLLGYWIEMTKPGTFESIFYERGKKTIREYKDLRDEVGDMLNDINLEYEGLKDEINNIFK